MKKMVQVLAMALCAAGLAAGCGGSSGEDGLSQQPQEVKQDNGMPNGAHFNLNIIGKSNPKEDVTCGDGHVIFVPLSGTARIGLSEGDFAVLDCNGTDGSAAFQLPNPDPTNSGTTVYSVWARALAKPGGQSTTTTCATEPLTGETYCSLYSMVLVREKGKSSFTNVSRELLYVYADIDLDGDVERVPLFDERLQDYFWSYQNQGLRLAQLRFYAEPTTVP
jgi:hypothetical protein